MNNIKTNSVRVKKLILNVCVFSVQDHCQFSRWPKFCRGILVLIDRNVQKRPLECKEFFLLSIHGIQHTECHIIAISAIIHFFLLHEQKLNRFHFYQIIYTVFDLIELFLQSFKWERWQHWRFSRVSIASNQ